MDEKCAVCGCEFHRSGGYAKPTIAGRIKLLRAAIEVGLEMIAERRAALGG